MSKPPRKPTLFEKIIPIEPWEFSHNRLRRQFNDKQRRIKRFHGKPPEVEYDEMTRPKHPPLKIVWRAGETRRREVELDTAPTNIIPIRGTPEIVRVNPGTTHDAPQSAWAGYEYTAHDLDAAESHVARKFAAFWRHLKMGGDIAAAADAYMSACRDRDEIAGKME